MAVVATAAFTGTYTKTWTIAADAADVAEAAVTHGFSSTPIDITIVDTTANATVTGNVWGIHTIGANTFTVRKALAAAQNRTALVVARLSHSIDR